MLLNNGALLVLTRQIFNPILLLVAATSWNASLSRVQGAFVCSGQLDYHQTTEKPNCAWSSTPCAYVLMENRNNASFTRARQQWQRNDLFTMPDCPRKFSHDCFRPVCEQRVLSLVKKWQRSSS